MFSTAIIIFREVLEAALILGIVMAATRGVRARNLWLGGAVVAGLAGASLVAGFAEAIAEAVAGIGQELFNATVLLIAVVMLAWHNIWMHRHGRELAQRMKQLGREVTEGELPMHVLAVVVALAVLREGSEVVLFLYGVAAQSTTSSSMLFGSGLGLAAGVAIGFALYFGLLRIPTRHLFTVTGWMILLLAAGMAAQAAGYLVQAGVLPPLGVAVWNSSALLAEHSMPGQVLHTLVGYTARPDGIQVIFYLVTLLTIGVLMKTTRNPLSGSAVLRTGTAVAGAAVLIASFLGLPGPAHASHKVYSPNVEKGELELEARGHVDDDNARKDKFEIGYGFTDRWFSSLFVEYEKEPDGDYRHEASAWENIFQLTETGRHWADVGLYLEYEWPKDGGKPDKVEAKLLLEKTVNRFVHTANLEFEKEVGSGAAGELEVGYAWRSAWLYSPRFEPAIEAYGSLGDFDDLGINDRQPHQLGPVARGKFRLGAKSAIAYEAGYLFGLTDASPDGSFKWLIEYERHL